MNRHLASIASALLTAACASAACAASKADELCALLAPADFQAAGVELAKVAGPPAFTTIAVRKGKLVFALGVPTTPKSQDAVVSLAKLVLQRGEKLAR